MKRFCGLLSALLACLLFTSIARAQQATWTSEARAYAAQHADDGALTSLVTAIERFDMTKAAGAQQDMKAILRDGWAGSHPAVEQVIAANSENFRLIYDAAMRSPLNLPPQHGVATPVPNFLSVQLLAQSMACEALRRQQAGDLTGAANTGVAVVRLGEILYGAKDQTLITGILGNKVSSIGMEAVQQIVIDSRLDNNTRQWLYAQMQGIDTRMPRPDQLFAGDCACSRMSFAELRDDPAKLADFLKTIQGDEALRSFINNLPSEAEIRSQQTMTLTILMQPYCELKNTVPPDSVGLWGKMMLPSYIQTAGRQEILRAQVRLCMAHLAIKAGKPDAAKTIIDPFGGGSFGSNGSVLFSLGPDCTSQNATQIHDPSKGLDSPGDIVLRMK